jgi:hypothetical protein
VSSRRRRILALHRDLVSTSANPTPLERWHSILDCEGDPEDARQVLTAHIPTFKNSLLVKAAALGDEFVNHPLNVTRLCISPLGLLAAAISYPPERALPGLLIEYRRRHANYNPDFWATSNYSVGHLLAFESFYVGWFRNYTADLISPDIEAIELRRRYHEHDLSELGDFIDPTPFPLRELPCGLYRALNLPVPASYAL